MTKPLDAREVNEVLKLAERCRPILAGHPPIRQGAVLVELLATWLAGYVSPDAEHLDRQATDALREHLLEQTIIAVRKLIPAEEAHILETREGRTTWSNP